MSEPVRYALYVGVLLALVYLGLRAWRSRGKLEGADLCESVGLALMPFPLPGAVDMVVKAFGSETLPIFNEAENRVALIFGGLILIATFLYGLVMAGRRAWEGR